MTQFSQALILFLIFVFLEWFLILPASLYVGGKIMKLQHEKFTFDNCMWMNFLAVLLAGLVAKVNVYLALGVFALILGMLIRKQFQAGYRTIVVMVVINAGVAIGAALLAYIILDGVLYSFLR